MTRTHQIVLGVALVAVAAVLLVIRTEDPTGMAIGRLAPAERDLHVKLWRAMEPTATSYLKEWADQLAEPPDDPLALIDAFNELAFAVTGPAGFWRKTVPTRYLGCPADPDSPPCQRLHEAQAEFQRWDALQARLSKVDTPAQARRALQQEGPAMQEYLGTMVPREPAADAMAETAFYARTLAPVLP